MTLTIKSLVGGIAQLLLFPLVLFLVAGTLAWPAAWVFLIMFYGFVIITVRLLLRRNPALLEERMSVFKLSPGRDIMFLLVCAISLVWLIVIPLDAVRFHWSQMPLWLQGIGALALLGAFALMYLAFRENAYLTPTVRIQEERRHVVVSTGPYQFVRHPMYTGFHLFFIGMPLLLGSVFGLVLSLALIGLVVSRAVLEERLLRQELPGYDAYMAHVTARFIPHVW
ncbi:MAG TPA: isoprenylcysteine carboxylmethyltransferase family protein [Ktedonobacteraceae bacterium]|jgi:protein-S-isoprenylcysteine O-methyltransferase Ste14